MAKLLAKFAYPVLVCISSSLLSGCFELGDPIDPNASVPSSNGPAVPPGTSTNSAPIISGNPSTVAVVGASWSFTPSATDVDNDTLIFVIDNKPIWAAFDYATGRLSGAPQLGHEGSYDNIRISVNDGKVSAMLPAFAVDVRSINSNTAPVISGNPSMSATVGQAYLFVPSASDADGGTLMFEIANPPRWATFDPTTGQLSGTAQQGDSALYSNIVISVNDGEMMASLPAFSINVAQVATSSVTLTWTPPTQNEDGTTLTDLASYKIYYGLSQGSYPNEIPIDNPGLTTYVVDNLTPNTYYFVSTSINSSGIESALSNVAMKVVN